MLEKAIRGRHFDSDEKVVNAAHTFFNSLSEEDFKKMISVKWVEKMKRGVGGSEANTSRKYPLPVVIVKVMLAMFEINPFFQNFFLLSFAKGTPNSVYASSCIF